MDALRCSDDDIFKVREYYNKDIQTIKDEVEILRAWIKQQRHLPQHPDDDFLERLLLRNKFRVEQTKTKLDGYYTMRGVYKEYISDPHLRAAREVGVTFPLPQMTPSMERVYFWRLECTNPEKFDQVEAIKYFMLVMEIIMRKDYSVGDIVIIDYKGMTLDHITKVKITDTATAVKLYMKAYSGRLRGMHMLNAPAFINIVLAMFKMILPVKLFERIQIHKDLESLHQSIDKKILPKEYGGDLESIDILRENWDKVFDSYAQFFESNSHNVSNEDLRIGDVPHNKGFGVDGTFRKLNLD